MQREVSSTALIAAVVLLAAAGAARGSEPIRLPIEPESVWPFERPLFALHARPRSEVRLTSAFAHHPEIDSLSFALEASWAFGPVGLRLRLPAGLAFGEAEPHAFTYGDVEIGALWNVYSDPGDQRCLSVGLDLIAPSSRIGERDDLADVAAGRSVDESNFGQRYLLAQRPYLDLGLNPRLNLGVRAWSGFGIELGRVSLQADIGFLVLVMDNVDASIYGTARRSGELIFADLAAPVALIEGLSISAEIHALVALGGLTGTGFAVTIGPRYTIAGFSAAAGVQLPLGVDMQPPDDDLMPGRYAHALIARQHVAALLDLSYAF